MLNKKYAINVFSVCFVEVLSLSGPFSEAQATTGEPQPGIVRPVKKAIASYRTEYLNRAVELPDLPPFPGRQPKLMRAVQLPRLGPSNTTVLQSFAVKEPAQEVRDWYQSALISYGWKIQKDDANQTFQLTARHLGGESCQIMAFSTPCRGDGYKTLLQIRFTRALSSIN